MREGRFDDLRVQGGTVILGKRVSLALAILGCVFLISPQVATAEPYVGLFVGAAIPEDKDVDATRRRDGLTILDGKLKDVEFDTSVVFGGKVGYFFTESRVFGGHFGLEFEVYHFRITALGFNELYRLPLLTSSNFPRGRLHPYIGVGLGILIANVETKTTLLDQQSELSDTSVKPGLQVLGGAKFFLSKDIALFGEYKFTHAGGFGFEGKESGTFLGIPATETIKGNFNLTTHMIYGGLAFHW